MPPTPQPDFVAIARSFGLVRAVYPVRQAFAEIGVGNTLGWELISQGELEAIRLTAKKTVVTATSMARFLHSRQQQPPVERMSDKFTAAKSA
jgi:hypothetical protein